MRKPMGKRNRRAVVALVVVLLVLALAGVFAITGHAKDRAMSQEEAYLDAELANASCIESYGTHETTDQKRASVIGVPPRWGHRPGPASLLVRN